MTVLLDTGPLVAILNRRDAYHLWSIEEADRLKPPFYSCEAVISEAHFLLQAVHKGREQLVRLVNSGRIDLSFSYAAYKERVGELMLQYANVPNSFDSSSLRASHFSVIFQTLSHIPTAGYPPFLTQED